MNTSLVETQQRLAVVEGTSGKNDTTSVPAGIPWLHTNAGACARYTPPSYPATVYIELGGAGGGGGAGIMNDGDTGSTSTVKSVETGTTLMAAFGGGGGKPGGQKVSGPLHGLGSSSVTGATVVKGGGAAGGLPGVVGFLLGWRGLWWRYSPVAALCPTAFRTLILRGFDVVGCKFPLLDWRVYI